MRQWLMENMFFDALRCIEVGSIRGSGAFRYIDRAQLDRLLRWMSYHFLENIYNFSIENIYNYSFNEGCVRVTQQKMPNAMQKGRCSTTYVWNCGDRFVGIGDTVTYYEEEDCSDKVEQSDKMW